MKTPTNLQLSLFTGLYSILLCNYEEGGEGCAPNRERRLDWTTFIVDMS